MASQFDQLFGDAVELIYDVHGVPATVDGKDVTGVFTEEDQGAALGGVPTDTREPVLLVRSADVDHAEYGAPVHVDGRTFSIVEIVRDHSAGRQLILREE